MERLSNLASHLTSSPASPQEKLHSKSPNDVVVVAAYRTALTKAKKGKLRDTKSAEILAGLLKGLLERTKLDPSLIQDIACGNVCNPGAGANEHRAAALAAGIPYTTPFQAINRQCSSGLIAINDIANKIAVGQIDIGIGAGVESMSNNYDPTSAGDFPVSFRSIPGARECEIGMGITSENVAAKYHISRREQDEFAALSYQKAAAAQDNGLFKDEIIPLTVNIANGGETVQVVVDEDDGIRRGVTVDSLAKVRPAFKSDGSTHAGNSSQITDGAGAVLLMRRSVAEKLGQPILAKIVTFKVVGVPPEIMGIGPSVAIPELLKDLSLTVDDIDIFEINEAFASQALYCVREIGIDIKKVNPKGGAIAFGHPLGATGARQFGTILTELKRTGKRVGITSMCMGSGMGAACLLVSEQ